MKISIKYLIILPLAFIFILPNSIYGANNSRFYGSYQGTVTDGCYKGESSTLIIGNDSTKLADGGYLYLPQTGNHIINRGYTNSNDPLVTTYVISGSKLTVTTVIQLAEDTSQIKVWVTEFVFRNNYKNGTAIGNQIDDFTGECEGKSKYTLRRVKK